MTMENVAVGIMILVFLAGLIQLAKWTLAIFDWVHEKLYVLCYGERITPYCLFKIDGWTYTPYKTIERYKK